MKTSTWSKVEREIQREAQQLIESGVGAAAFSEHFFGPRGRLAALGADREQRAAVAGSELYGWLQTQLADLRRREVAAFEQEIAPLSGRLTIQVPRSLHAALKEEAVLEGVSLSELIRLKLGVPYRLTVRSLAGGRARGAAAASKTRR